MRLSWRELAKMLLLWYDTLSDIERRYISDEARLKAVVEAFLLGEGDYHPSWRRLIHQLHWAEQSHVAEMIKANAEPHQGAWVSWYREEMINPHTQCVHLDVYACESIICTCTYENVYVYDSVYGVCVCVLCVCVCWKLLSNQVH